MDIVLGEISLNVAFNAHVVMSINTV